MEKIKPNHIVGIAQSRDGRTLVAADNGVFELRSHAKGDELVLLAPAEREPALAEAVEREGQQRTELEKLVAASRAKEASDGNSDSKNQQEVHAAQDERQAFQQQDQQTVESPVVEGEKAKEA